MNAQLNSLRGRILVWQPALIISVILLAMGWLLNTPEGLLGKADAVSYAVCHRIDLRSFHLGERQLPLCARCTGMYLGAIIGLGYQQWLSKRRTGTPAWQVLVVGGFLVAAFAIDGLNSYLSLFPGVPHLYQPQNWSRLLTGTGMGLTIAGALFPSFNQSAWKESDPLPALNGFVQVGGLLLLGLLVDGLVLSENPLLIYPLALISTAGVLLLLTLVYSIVWLILFKQENRFESFRQLWAPLIGGFGMALLQIALLDAGRFILTGTWEGFHIG